MAHKLTKERPPPPSVELVMDDEGRQVSRHAQVVKHYEQYWRKIWNPSHLEKPRLNFHGVDEEPQLVELNSDLVRAAARCFKATTSHVCGLHPCNVAHLSPGALKHLVQLFRLWELAGDQEGCESVLVFRLLAKPTGGRRPICLFRSLPLFWPKLVAMK